MAGVRPFEDTLRMLRYGETSDELAKKMNELIAFVTSNNKKGVLTFKIKVSPTKGGQVEIEDEIDLKLPKLSRGATLAWATPENNLTRQDPRQQTLPNIRSADEPQAKPREVSAAQG